MKRILLAIPPLLFSLLSMIFALLALTSSKWSIQKYYLNTDGASGLGTDWTKPICHASKSPFFRCDVPILAAAVGTNPPKCTVPSCRFYAPYGKDKTSCRLAAETGNVESGLNGNELECQQVHYTGNLQIAASTFLTLAFITLLPLTLLKILKSPAHSKTNIPNTTTTTTTAPSEEPITESEPKTHPPPSHPTKFRKKLYHFLRVLPTIALLFLFTGVILQVFAQFFGIMSMTQNATPTAYVAVQNARDTLGATPWVMDRALSGYATTAWVMGLSAALWIRGFYGVKK